MIKFKSLVMIDNEQMAHWIDNPDSISPIISMSEMDPLDVALIADNSQMNDIGCMVMRLNDEDDFKVINLSRPEVNAYWPKDNRRKVRLLPKGTKIILEVV